MLHAHQIEELLRVVSTMDRPTIARQFRDFRATFPVDFTPQFVESADLERLRHIFLALCLQAQRMPEVEGVEAGAVLEHVA